MLIVLDNLLSARLTPSQAIADSSTVSHRSFYRLHVSHQEVQASSINVRKSWMKPLTIYAPSAWQSQTMQRASCHPVVSLLLVCIPKTNLEGLPFWRCWASIKNAPDFHCLILGSNSTPTGQRSISVDRGSVQAPKPEYYGRRTFSPPTSLPGTPDGLRGSTFVAPRFRYHARTSD